MRKLNSIMLIASVLLFSEGALADKLKLPEGMGGVPDIGAIPCSVFGEMLVIGALGTRLSLLTWADGYYYAKTGKTMDEILDSAATTDGAWSFERLTDHFVNYCADNPDVITRDAVVSLGAELIRDGS